MSHARPRGPIVIDTDVFSADLVPGAPLADRYAPIIAGRPALISFQTVAELRYGALRRGWGHARMLRLEAKTQRAEIVHTGPELVLVYAQLRADCEARGHGSPNAPTPRTAGSPRPRSDSACHSSPTTRSSATSPTSPSSRSPADLGELGRSLPQTCGRHSSYHAKAAAPFGARRLPSCMEKSTAGFGRFGCSCQAKAEAPTGRARDVPTSISMAREARRLQSPGALTVWHGRAAVAVAPHSSLDPRARLEEDRGTPVSRGSEAPLCRRLGFDPSAVGRGD